MLDGGAPNYRCYQCADGKWVAVGAIEPQFWSALVAALGLDEATTPGPYAPQDWDDCKKVLSETFRTRTRDEWAAVFESLDACVAPVLTLAEALEHPHNVARGSFTTVGDAPMPGPAPHFSVTPGAAGSVQEIGSSTAQLLAELGYGASELAELRSAGLIA
jgi:alpha-methylacyl-CoA racemase